MVPPKLASAGPAIAGNFSSVIKERSQKSGLLTGALNRNFIFGKETKALFGLSKILLICTLKCTEGVADFYAADFHCFSPYWYFALTNTVNWHKYCQHNHFKWLQSSPPLAEEHIPSLSIASAFGWLTVEDEELED